MSPVVTGILIGVAILPALLLVWFVAVHAKRQAEANARELEEDKRLGLVPGHDPHDDDSPRDATTPPTP